MNYTNCYDFIHIIFLLLYLIIHIVNCLLYYVLNIIK